MAFEDIGIGTYVTINDDGKIVKGAKVIGFFYLFDFDLQTCKSATEAMKNADNGYFGVVVDVETHDKRMFFKDMNGFGFAIEDILLIESGATKPGGPDRSSLLSLINKDRFSRAEREISNPQMWTYDDLILEAQRLRILEQ